MKGFPMSPESTLLAGRCPACLLPVTPEEVGIGACPWCDRPFASPSPAQIVETGACPSCHRPFIGPPRDVRSKTHWSPGFIWGLIMGGFLTLTAVGGGSYLLTGQFGE